MTNPHYEAVKRALKKKPRTWLLTGCAGFIGSNLIEMLRQLNQNMVGLEKSCCQFLAGAQIISRCL